MDFSKATESKVIIKVIKIEETKKYEWKLFKWPSVKNASTRSPKLYSRLEHCRRAVDDLYKDYKRAGYNVEIEDKYPRRNRQAS
jgi:hypothetical protein